MYCLKYFVEIILNSIFLIIRWSNSLAGRAVMSNGPHASCMPRIAYHCYTSLLEATAELLITSQSSFMFVGLVCNRNMLAGSYATQAKQFEGNG
jgi:hypothetical protein